jgi:hypothetical protein
MSGGAAVGISGLDWDSSSADHGVLDVRYSAVFEACRPNAITIGGWTTVAIRTNQEVRASDYR